MTLRTTIIASTCATLALAWVAASSPASARWTFHDESLGEKVVAPPGGTRAQTCSDHLHAWSGSAAFIDVEAGDDPESYEIPSWARTPVDYQVWKAPRGFDNFSGAIQDTEAGEVYFEDLDGTRHQATLVAAVTTPDREPLGTPEPSNGNPELSGNFVFTAAPISARLRGVAPGDVLGLIPAAEAGGIFVDVTAMNCGLPLLRSRVDVVPGSRANTVNPQDGTALVPTRIFGSRHLNVRRIRVVHLGEAAPATVPEALKPSLRPRDVDGDGRLDRLYYFRQGETDIMCIDTSVRVTGRTSDAKLFQARSEITTSGCDG